MKAEWSAPCDPASWMPGALGRLDDVSLIASPYLRPGEVISIPWPAGGERPQFIAAHPRVVMLIEMEVEGSRVRDIARMAGANWRRVKREVRKARDRVRKEWR